MISVEVNSSSCHYLFIYQKHMIEYYGLKDLLNVKQVRLNICQCYQPVYLVNEHFCYKFIA